MFAALVAALHSGSAYAGCAVTGTITGQHCGADYIQVFADTGTASLTVNDETTASVEIRPPVSPSGGPYDQTINLTGNTVINNPSYSGVIMQTNEATRTATVNAGAGVSITSNGGFGGIWVRNDTSGDVTITSSATVNATGGDGVTGTSNLGAVSVTNHGNVTTTTDRGLYADGGSNNPSAVLVKITNTGTVNSNLAGARSINYKGLSSIENSGTVTTTTRQGLVAWSNDGPVSITNSGTVTSGDDNTLHGASEFGDITITNSGTLTAIDDPAIVASRAGYSGIRASVDMDPSATGANGAISITNSAAGQITAASDYAIAAETPLGNISISNAGTASGKHGISANAVSGALTITNSNQLTATDAAGYGIDILAAVGGTLTNSGAITAPTALKSAAGSTLTQINNQTGGTLDGILSLSGSAAFANAGTLILPANTTSTITGSYTQNIGASAGTLKSRVTNSSQFGKLSVVGTATLSTTARIEVITGNPATCVGITVGDTLASVISATTLNATTLNAADDCTNLDLVAVKNGNAIDLVAANIVNGSCGSANNSVSGAAPTTNLCTTGDASSVTGSGPWNWTCQGTSSGVTASCSASIPPPADPAPGNTTLPTGGGTAAPTGGQTVIVTDNGSNGSTITMPSPTTTSGGASTVNTIKVELPNNTGAVNVASNSEGTKLGVQNTVLPGTNTTVTTVTVDQGSASFTATKKDQPLAGLKNGIIVVSGTDSSKVTVDTTGGAAQIGIATSDTIIVPKGIPNVSGTVVELPNPQTNGGAAPTVTVKAGDQTLTVKASQADTTMTFQVVDIGGVQTPVLTVTGIATVGIAGESQPLVSIGGNVITSGNSSGNVGKLKCNTLVEASTETVKDIVQVNTCYIVLAPGTFSALSGGVGNSFAAIKDGIVWAGETAEFDKNGAVIGAYLGTKGGATSAVGDDIVPGGGKFSAGYTNNAFIPRLTGSPLRLNEAKLDESLFGVFNTALNATTLPATPSQSAQGILNFQVSGGADSLQKAQAALTFDLVGDLVSIFPSKRIRVDTARADGITVSNEGNVEVATGGLVTTFVPTVADPQGFAADIATLFPGAVSEMRWNGSWKVTTSDGRMFVGRPQWGIQSSASGNTFTALADGTVTYSANGRTQVLFPDFHDYTTLLATFSKELNDPNLKVAPRMNGSVQATVNGRTYLLYPQWTLIPASQITGKPSWWLDNGVVYIKNADGTAQGFGVK